MVVAQVPDSRFEIVDFKRNRLPSGETGESGLLSTANVPAPMS
jgi:hypothetical protein